MKRPPRTAPLAAALISAVAVAVLTLCTTLFLRSYRSAVVEAARTNSAPGRQPGRGDRGQLCEHNGQRRLYRHGAAGRRHRQPATPF